MFYSQRFLILFAIATRRAHGIGESPPEKRRILGSVAANGVVKIIDGLDASPPKASSSLVRTTYSGNAGGDVTHVSDSLVDSTSTASPSPVRFSGSVAANGVVKLTKGITASMPKVAPTALRAAFSGSAAGDDVTEHSDGSPSLVRVSGSVGANGIVNITDGLAAAMPKVAPSVERIAKELEGGVADGVGVISISDGRVDFAPDMPPSLVRRSKEENDLEVDDNRILERSADLGEEVNVTRDDSVRKTDLIRLTNNDDFRSWLNNDVPPIKSSSRYITVSISHLHFTSSIFTAALLIILLFLVSIILVLLMRRNESVVQRWPETTYTYLQESTVTDSGSEVWEGECQQWEGFLWKLNKQVGAEERLNWTHWRTRLFCITPGVLSENSNEVGLCVEFVSEKGNMARVGSWISARHPAIVTSLKPIQMASVNSSESESIILRTNQYLCAIDVDSPPETALPTILYPLSIVFQNSNSSLIVASSNPQLIFDFARQLEAHPKSLHPHLFDRLAT